MPKEINGWKFCPKCSSRKKLSEFWKDKSTFDKFTNSCKKCLDSYSRQFRESHPEYMSALMHKRSLAKIGLTFEDYQNQGKSQEWKCAICGTKPENKLCADHNHITGKFRGLLCQRCNRAIGLLRDSTDVLSRAIAYLENDKEILCQKACPE